MLWRSGTSNSLACRSESCASCVSGSGASISGVSGSGASVSGVSGSGASVSRVSGSGGEFPVTGDRECSFPPSRAAKARLCGSASLRAPFSRLVLQEPSGVLLSGAIYHMCASHVPHSTFLCTLFERRPPCSLPFSPFLSCTFLSSPVLLPLIQAWLLAVRAACSSNERAPAMPFCSWSASPQRPRPTARLESPV